MRVDWNRRAAAGLMVGLGVARGIGGAVLVTQDRPGLGLGLAAVGLLCVVAGVLVWRTHRAAPQLVLVALLAFLVGGFINGTVLYGHPRVAGVIGNLIYAVVVTVLLQRAQRGSPR
jgi:hypothetical protein